MHPSLAWRTLLDSFITIATAYVSGDGRARWREVDSLFCGRATWLVRVLPVELLWKYSASFLASMSFTSAYSNQTLLLL